MGNKKSLLKMSYLNVAPKIILRIPTVGEILDNEDSYYGLSSSLTSTPFQYMVQLDDMGIDYTSINEWDLFRMMFINYSNQEVMYRSRLKELDEEIKKCQPNSDSYTSFKSQIDAINDILNNNAFNIVFKDFELTGEINGEFVGFKEYYYEKENKKNIVLFNPATKVEIDRLVYKDLTDNIRKINMFNKVRSKPGNEEARRYLLEKERKRQKRNANKPREPYLERMVIALVNTSEFPYNYDSCMDLSIYNFNQSLKQIQRKIVFDNTMIGVYSGTVDTSKMANKDALSWIPIK